MAYFKDVIPDRALPSYYGIYWNIRSFEDVPVLSVVEDKFIFLDTAAFLVSNPFRKVII